MTQIHGLPELLATFEILGHYSAIRPICIQGCLPCLLVYHANNGPTPRSSGLCATLIQALLWLAVYVNDGPQRACLRLPGL